MIRDLNLLDAQMYGQTEKLKTHFQVITFGNFDGVHLGHQHMLKTIRTNISADEVFVLVTFDPHPIFYFDPHCQNYLIQSLESRIQKLLKFCDVVVVQNFSQPFAQLTHQEFCTNWLLKMFCPTKVFFGFNFTYGKGREGNAAMFQKFADEYDISFCLLPAFTDDGTCVSSTFIRGLIENNDFQRANNCLGHDFCLDGIVIHGDKRGRAMGFPTANLQWDPKRLLTQNGVYACEMTIEDRPKRYPGVMNVGLRPTLSSPDPKIHVEGHLFNFDGDLYGKKLRLYPLKFIRAEKKFANLQSLQKQIQADVQSCCTFFNIDGQ